MPVKDMLLLEKISHACSKVCDTNTKLFARRTWWPDKVNKGIIYLHGSRQLTWRKKRLEQRTKIALLSGAPTDTKGARCPP